MRQCTKRSLAWQARACEGTLWSWLLEQWRNVPVKGRAVERAGVFEADDAPPVEDERGWRVNDSIGDNGALAYIPQGGVGDSYAPQERRDGLGVVGRVDTNDDQTRALLSTVHFL